MHIRVRNRFVSGREGLISGVILIIVITLPRHCSVVILTVSLYKRYLITRFRFAEPVQLPLLTPCCNSVILPFGKGRTFETSHFALALAWACPLVELKQGSSQIAL